MMNNQVIKDYDSMIVTDEKGNDTLFITGENLRQAVINNINKMKERYDSDPEIPFLMIELNGGKCPVCSKEYRLIEVNNKHGFFKYYRAKCRCYKNMMRDKAEHLRRELEFSISGIPKKLINCTFANWDPLSDEGLNKVKAIIERLTNTGKIFEQQGILLMGTSGTGKSHLAVCILKEALSNNKTIKFIKMADFIQNVIADNDNKTGIPKEDFVLLDDFDKLKSSSDFAYERIYSLIEGVRSDGRNIIITTNFDWNQMNEKYDEALISRLKESEFFTLNGNDYREFRRLKK